MKQLNWNIPKLKKAEEYSISEVRVSTSGEYYYTINGVRYYFPIKLLAMVSRDSFAEHNNQKALYFPMECTIPDNLNLQI